MLVICRADREGSLDKCFEASPSNSQIPKPESPLSLWTNASKTQDDTLFDIATEVFTDVR